MMPAPRQPQGSTRSPAPDIAFSRTLLLATDLQQSILAELDRSGPSRLAYTAYGSQSQRTAGTHLGFNGQLKERPTGWYHLGNGHRVYNPVLMRFHSPDRLSPFDKGGVNAYAYCKGDPINFEDPTGQYGEAIARLIQLSATTALHGGIVMTNLVGAKAAGWMLHAARMSTVASTTAMVGTVGQLSGWSAAVYISNAATTVSAAATIVRYAPAIVNGLRAGTLWQTVKNNVRNLVKGTAFPKPAKIPSPSPSPSPSASTPGNEAVFIAMEGIAPPSKPTDVFTRGENIRRGSTEGAAVRKRRNSF